MKKNWFSFEFNKWLCTAIVLQLCGVSCTDTEFSFRTESVAENLSLAAVSPAKKEVISDSRFEFEWNVSSPSGKEFHEMSVLTVGSLSNKILDVKFYNTPDCSKNPLPRSDKRVEGVVPSESLLPIRHKEDLPLKMGRKKISIEGLSDGDIITAQMTYAIGSTKLQSECTKPVYVDTQPPFPVTFLLPVSDYYTGLNKFRIQFQPAVDRGVGGLSDVPYKVRLHSRPNCLGDILQEKKLKEVSLEFDNLISGKFYSVSVTAEDAAGNASTPSCSSAVEVDTTVPSIEIIDVNSAVGYTRTLSPELRLGNYASGEYFCITENSTFTPMGLSAACPGLGPLNGWHTTAPTNINLTPGEGLKNINFWSVDSNGELVSSRPGAVQITYDVTPVDNFSVIGVGGNLDLNFDSFLFSTTDPVVSFITSDSVDILKYEVSVLDVFSNQLCGPAIIDHPTDQANLFGCPIADGGNYQVRLIGYDRAFNSAIRLFNFELDLTPPDDFTISGVMGGDDIILDNYIGAALPQVHYSDAGDEIKYDIRVRDGSDNEICSEESESANVLVHDYESSPGATCSTLSEGEPYYLEIYASDLAGNRKAASNTNFEFIPDFTGPVVAFTQTPNTVEILSSTSFSFNAVDALSLVNRLECDLNGLGYSNCSSPWMLNGLSEGPQVFTVRAVDAVGNTSQVSNSWSVDLTDPTLTVTTSPTLFTNTATPEIAFIAVDSFGIEKIECREGSGSWSVCSSPWTGSSSEGLYSVELRAFDNSGRTSNAVVNFTVDRTPPSINFSIAPTLVTSGTDLASATFDFSASDASPLSSVRCKIDSEAWTNCATSETINNLNAGEHTFYLEVEDSAGNVESVSRSFIVWTHSWSSGSYGSCSATPSWSGFGSCSATPSWSGYGGCSAPAGTYSVGGWGACSASCGYGTRYRSATCVPGNGLRTRTCQNTNGTQTRTCLNTSGVQNRSVVCMRSTGSSITAVSDSSCSFVKPPEAQSCTASCSGSSSQPCTGSCSGSSTTSCTSSCGTAPATSQSCYAGSCAPTCSNLAGGRRYQAGGEWAIPKGWTSFSVSSLGLSGALVACQNWCSSHPSIVSGDGCHGFTYDGGANLSCILKPGPLVYNGRTTDYGTICN